MYNANLGISMTDDSVPRDNNLLMDMGTEHDWTPYVEDRHAHPEMETTIKITNVQGNTKHFYDEQNSFNQNNKFDKATRHQYDCFKINQTENVKQAPQMLSYLKNGCQGKNDATNNPTDVYDISNMNSITSDNKLELNRRKRRNNISLDKSEDDGMQPSTHTLNTNNNRIKITIRDKKLNENVDPKPHIPNLIKFYECIICDNDPADDQLLHRKSIKSISQAQVSKQDKSCASPGETTTVTMASCVTSCHMTVVSQNAHNNVQEMTSVTDSSPHTTMTTHVTGNETIQSHISSTPGAFINSFNIIPRKDSVSNEEADGKRLDNSKSLRLPILPKEPIIKLTKNKVRNTSLIDNTQQANGNLNDLVGLTNSETVSNMATDPISSGNVNVGINKFSSSKGQTGDDTNKIIDDVSSRDNTTTSDTETLIRHDKNNSHVGDPTQTMHSRVATVNGEESTSDSIYENLIAESKTLKEPSPANSGSIAEVKDNVDVDSSTSPGNNPTASNSLREADEPFNLSKKSSRGRKKSVIRQSIDTQDREVSAIRLGHEFPRHNWLERKINSLGQPHSNAASDPDTSSAKTELTGHYHGVLQDIGENTIASLEETASACSYSRSAELVKNDSSGSTVSDTISKMTSVLQSPFSFHGSPTERAVGMVFKDAYGSEDERLIIADDELSDANESTSNSGTVFNATESQMKNTNDLTDVCNDSITNSNELTGDFDNNGNYSGTPNVSSDNHAPSLDPAVKDTDAYAYSTNVTETNSLKSTCNLMNISDKYKFTVGNESTKDMEEAHSKIKRLASCSFQNNVPSLIKDPSQITPCADSESDGNEPSQYHKTSNEGGMRSMSGEDHDESQPLDLTIGSGSNEKTISSEDYAGTSTSANMKSRQPPVMKVHPNCYGQVLTESPTADASVIETDSAAVPTISENICLFSDAKTKDPCVIGNPVACNNVPKSAVVGKDNIPDVADVIMSNQNVIGTNIVSGRLNASVTHDDILSKSGPMVAINDRESLYKYSRKPPLHSVVDLTGGSSSPDVTAVSPRSPRAQKVVHTASSCVGDKNATSAENIEILEAELTVLTHLAEEKEREYLRLTKLKRKREDLLCAMKKHKLENKDTKHSKTQSINSVAILNKNENPGVLELPAVSVSQSVVELEPQPAHIARPDRPPPLVPYHASDNSKLLKPVAAHRQKPYNLNNRDTSHSITKVTENLSSSKNCISTSPMNMKSEKQKLSPLCTESQQKIYSDQSALTQSLKPSMSYYKNTGSLLPKALQTMYKQFTHQRNTITSTKCPSYNSPNIDQMPDQDSVIQDNYNQSNSNYQAKCASNQKQLRHNLTSSSMAQWPVAILPKPLSTLTRIPPISGSNIQNQCRRPGISAPTTYPGRLPMSQTTPFQSNNNTGVFRQLVPNVIGQRLPSTPTYTNLSGQCTVSSYTARPYVPYDISKIQPMIPLPAYALQDNYNLPYNNGIDHNNTLHAPAPRLSTNYPVFTYPKPQEHSLQYPHPVTYPPLGTGPHYQMINRPQTNIPEHWIDTKTRPVMHSTPTDTVPVYRQHQVPYSPHNLSHISAIAGNLNSSYPVHQNNHQNGYQNEIVSSNKDAMTQPYTTPNSSMCSVCKRPAGMLCSGCRQVRYCSKQCQIAGWKQHASACNQSLNS